MINTVKVIVLMIITCKSTLYQDGQICAVLHVYTYHSILADEMQIKHLLNAVQHYRYEYKCISHIDLKDTLYFKPL